MKVYAVWTGEYSDADVLGIYSSEEAARDVADLVSGTVEPYELDAVKPEDPGEDFWVVEIDKSGRITKLVNKGRLDTSGELHTPFSYLRTHKDEPYMRASYWRLHVERYFPSEEHARRHATELWRQILAGQRPEGVDMGEN